MTDVLTDTGFFEVEPPIFGETELVKLAIAFANTGTIEAYAPFASPRAEYREIDLETGEPKTEAIFEAAETVRERQAQLTAALAAVIKKRVPREQAALWCAAASSVVPVSSFRMDGRKLRAEVHYRTATRAFESGLGSLLSLTLCLLLDAKRPFGRDLCRCRECGVFFLAAPPKKQGRRRTLFCSSKHQKDSERAKTRERVGNWYRAHKAKQAAAAAKHK